MRVLIFIIALSITLPVAGQRKKKDEEEEELTPQYTEGVMYALPQTGIRLHVEAIETEFTPGPFARFADQLLGISDVKTQPGADWEISNVFFESFSEPDPSQVYKAMGEIASLISLAPDGCLAGINCSGDLKSKIKTVTNPLLNSDDIDEYQFTNLSDMPFFSPGDSTNRFRPARLSIEQKAAQAATRILECRRMKFEMAAGYLDVFPPDGKGYEESLKQLGKIEKEFLALFIGKSISEKHHVSFEYIPSVNTNKGEVIFRFSEEKGILEKSDLTGKPVMIEVTKVAGLTNNYERLKNSENPDAGVSGVYYRQPGMAGVKLIYELKAVAELKIPIAQFGVTAPIPEIFLDGSYSLEFHPQTGAIKNISLK